MGDICFVLIHPVYDKTQVFVLILLTLLPVLSILLPLTPGAHQQTSAKFYLPLKNNDSFVAVGIVSLLLMLRTHNNTDGNKLRRA